MLCWEAAMTAQDTSAARTPGKGHHVTIHCIARLYGGDRSIAALLSLCVIALAAAVPARAEYPERLSAINDMLLTKRPRRHKVLPNSLT